MMSTASSHELVFIATRSPWDGSSASAGADLLMTAAVFEQAVRLIFCGDGVWQLLGNQDGGKLRMKTLSRIYPAFELYDIRHIAVSDTAMRERGLSLSDLVVEASVVGDEEIRAWIASSKMTFVF